MTITARSPEQKKLEVIEAVAALARERLPARQAGGVEAFVRRYYAGVSAEDLCEREVPDLYGAALAHFGLLRERRPAELKLGSTTRASRSTAGSPPTRSSRWSPTICPSWWTLWSWS